MKQWQIFKKLNEKKEIISGSTIKDNTFSYDFSLATHTGENLDKISKNRDIFSSKFPSVYKFVTLNQIHSNLVINVDEYIANKKWISLPIDADGMVSSKKNVTLTILTADCLAIVAYDNEAKVIGAAHAGWRGVEQNIAKNLIDKMEKLGAKKSNIFFALSPSIKGCCYEVGLDVAKHFFKYPNSLKMKKNSKYMLDISIAQREQLKELGIKEQQIEVSSICTSCESSRYFSYRKECGCSGRFATFIAMV